MHPCAGMMTAGGLITALETSFFPGFAVLCWFVLGWGCFVSSSHFNTHLSDQYSVSSASSFTSTHSSQTGSRRLWIPLCSLLTPYPCFRNSTHSYRIGALQACSWDGQQWNHPSALQQCPLTPAGEWAFAQAMASASQQALARWIKHLTAQNALETFCVVLHLQGSSASCSILKKSGWIDNCF